MEKFNHIDKQKNSRYEVVNAPFFVMVKITKRNSTKKERHDKHGNYKGKNDVSKILIE